jgi:hypothetical protein
MEKQTLIIEMPRRRRRAIELYAANSPFKQKVVQSKLRFRRRDKHQKDWDY